MKQYMIIRITKALITILVVWTAIFFLSRLTGDPVHWILGESYTIEAYERLTKEMRFDLPLVEQYFMTLGNAIRGDMGDSYFYNRPVSELFFERLGLTLALQGIVFVFSTISGIFLGSLAAMRHNKPVDKVIRFFTIIGYTLPSFILAILLIFLFALRLHVLPSGNIGTFRHFILPALVLSVGPIASVTLFTRSSMLDTLHRDYIDLARMKGISEFFVIQRHALRNALLPVVTILGGQLAKLIGGALVVETVFSLPGIGNLVISAVSQRDFPLLQYSIFILIISITLINLLVDLFYMVLDPRIQESGLYGQL